MNITPQTYQQLIVAGIQDLPTDLLIEIADFVYFLRQRATAPEIFGAEQYALLINQDLTQMSAAEAAHLEAEFATYEQQHPHE